MVSTYTSYPSTKVSQVTETIHWRYVRLAHRHKLTYLLSRQTVKRNQQQYSMPLKILSYNELYGWTMDAVVAQIGKKNNCTFCGVFRRQALDRGAAMLNVDHIVTGHNADDIAETVLMNSRAAVSNVSDHWKLIIHP